MIFGPSSLVGVMTDSIEQIHSNDIFTGTDDVHKHRMVDDECV